MLFKLKRVLSNYGNETEVLILECEALSRSTSLWSQRLVKWWSRKIVWNLFDVFHFENKDKIQSAFCVMEDQW